MPTPTIASKALPLPQPRRPHHGISNQQRPQLRPRIYSVHIQALAATAPVPSGAGACIYRRLHPQRPLTRRPHPGARIYGAILPCVRSYGACPSGAGAWGLLGQAHRPTEAQIAPKLATTHPNLYKNQVSNTRPPCATIVPSTSAHRQSFS